MIINKEQQEFIRPDGSKGKRLIVSYTSPDKKIQYLRWEIPSEYMFDWEYDKSAKHLHADKEWKSWDGKPIRKKPVNNLCDFRIYEILNSFGEQLNPIYDLNIPDTWFCDIETDVDEDGMSLAENPRTPVNTIALTKFPRTIVWGRKPLSDSDIQYIKNKFKSHPNAMIRKYEFEFRYFPNEADMLMDFFRFISSPEIPAITGWNFLGYDWMYLYNRAVDKLGFCIDSERLDRPYNLAILSPTGKFYNYKVSNKFGTRNVQLPMHKIVYDYQMVYEKWDQTIKIKENNSLDFVSEKTLGYKKVQHKLSFKDFYAQEYPDYVFYNCVDTILVEHIDAKIHTANIWYSMGSILHTELMSTFSTINPAEIVMVNECYAKKQVVIKKDEIEEGDQSFIGAFVWPSLPGVYKFIGGLDFASLYPTTIRQFNLSPETYKFTDGWYDQGHEGEHKHWHVGNYVPKADEIKTVYGAVFDNTDQGIVPFICEKYYKQRKYSKKLKKQATKDYEYLKQILDERLKNAA